MVDESSCLVLRDVISIPVELVYPTRAFLFMLGCIFHDGVLVGNSTRTPTVREMTQEFFNHWHCPSTFSCQDQFVWDTSENGPGMSPVSFMDWIAWVKLGRRTWSHGSSGESDMLFSYPRTPAHPSLSRVSMRFGRAFHRRCLSRSSSTA